MKALTANRLDDGEVVFWRAGAWTRRFSEAAVFEDAALAEVVEAEAKAQQTVVVDVYLIDVVDVGGRPAPLSYRERLRALGPTNHLAHGKQAEGGAAIAALRRAAGASRSSGRINLIKRK